MTSLNEEPMTDQEGNTFLTRKVSRMHFVKQVSMLTGALFVGCSPVRILLKDYPKKFDTNEELADSFLRAFVATVIPGTPIDDPNLTLYWSSSPAWNTGFIYDDSCAGTENPKVRDISSIRITFFMTSDPLLWSQHTSPCKRKCQRIVIRL